MTKLIIGMESVEIKVAKNQVLLNLKMLNDRLCGLHQNSSIHSCLHAFYTRKIDEQSGILEWLNQYDQESTPT
jgi:lipopolysaccharide biosynthesis protein